MDKVFHDVKRFMLAAGQRTDTKMDASDSQCRLYKNLIGEEFNEFQNAYEQRDDVEILDACFDMIWVIVGYMHSRGWDCEGAWEEGAQSNLIKIDPVTGLVRRREDGKILKPDGWQPPNFEQFM
jgi:predicted HAD superfamily Cof-like phosphohydrolase